MTRCNLEVAANFGKVLPSCIASLAVMLFCCPSTTTLGQTSSSGTNKAARQTTTKPAPGIKAPQPAPTPAAPKPTLTAAPANVPKSIVSNEPKSDAYRLQHKLKVGEVVRTRTVHFANTVTRVQGTEDISESKTTSDKAWQVSSVSPSGEMTFEYRIDAVDMYQKVGENDPVTYNSRTDKEAPEMFAGVAGTIEKPIATVTIDPTGTVIERDKQTKAPPLGMGELAVPLPKEPVALGLNGTFHANVASSSRMVLKRQSRFASSIRWKKFPRALQPSEWNRNPLHRSMMHLSKLSSCSS